VVEASVVGAPEAELQDVERFHAERGTASAVAERAARRRLVRPPARPAASLAGSPASPAESVASMYAQSA
jgi:hypothetical protein